MLINRSYLLQELKTFVSQGNGLIIGKPGIGKSFLIRELRKVLSNNGELCFIIRIDNAANWNDESIQTQLELGNKNWIETFKKIKLNNNKKATLIFDSFDAAREEEMRKGFLSQIRKAKKELEGKWNIIVSVRTYDAAKSPELIKLFPAVNGNITKKFEVGALSNEEFEQALNQDESFSSFYKTLGAELQEILRIPFFLEIMEEVILASTETELQGIRKFRSETQILHAYWEKKITSTTNGIDKHLFLSNLTNVLVTERKLSTKKFDFLNNQKRDFTQVFPVLLSENILEESSIYDQRIAFSHNILFDYAVNYYCINPDLQSILSFIKDDLTRPFFLRPSFLYFFTTLWYYDRKIFWELYWALFKIEQKEIQLLVRLVMNGILASEFNGFDDLKPVLDNLALTPDTHSIVVRNILQSIRFIKKVCDDSDIDLLVRLSSIIHVNFIFEISFLLERAMNNGFTPNKIIEIGQASRNLLNFVFEAKNKSESSEYVERIGFQRGIELVAKTFATSIDQSKKLIDKILSFLNDKNFDIGWITNLSEYCKYIIQHDPQTVADIYQKVFLYRENSIDKTTMGGSVLFNFTSNRRQDFEMCYYRLLMAFPDFLNQAPKLALETGLNVAKDYILNEKINRTSKEQVHQFNINNLNCHYIPDHSLIWGDRTVGKAPEMVNILIGYIEKLFHQNLFDEGLEFVQLYLKNASVGFIWKQLLKMASKFPEQLAQYLFPILVTPIIVKSQDTSFEVRELIAKFVPFLNSDQVRQIEEVAFSVYGLESTITLSRLLSRIPENFIQSDKTLEFFRVNPKMENEPAITFTSTASSVTTEMWLEDEGVDISDTNNKELIEIQKKLSDFNNKWSNNTPSSSAYNEYIVIIKRVYDQIIANSEISNSLHFTVLHEVSQTAANIVKDYINLSSEEFAIIKNLIIALFQFKSKNDLNSDDEQGAFMVYSPTPRTAASQGLIYLALRETTPQNLNFFKQAVTDNWSIIRINAIRSISLFFKLDKKLYYELLDERLENENNANVYSLLLGNLVFKKNTIGEQAEKYLAIINKNVNRFSHNDTFLDNYTELLLFFATGHKISLAYESLRGAYENDKLLALVIFKIFEKMHPSLPENDYQKSPNLYKSELEVIEVYLLNASKGLNVSNKDEINLSRPDIKKALMVIDKVVQRIYFLLEPKTFNRQDFELPINESNRKAFYFIIKPVYKQILNFSGSITSQGLIIAHTAHYFIESLNMLFSYDPKEILSMVLEITEYAIQTQYTFDSSSIQSIVSMTEKLLAEHRDLLLYQDSFKDLIDLLDIYINSGWTDALELLWKLDQIFK